MPDPILVHDDLELYLTTRFRLLLAARPEPICNDVEVDRTHVMVKGHFVAEGGPDLIAQIDANGFESYEAKEAAVEQAEA